MSPARIVRELGSFRVRLGRVLRCGCRRICDGLSRSEEKELYVSIHCKSRYTMRSTWRFFPSFVSRLEMQRGVRKKR